MAAAQDFVSFNDHVLWTENIEFDIKGKFDWPMSQ